MSTSRSHPSSSSSSSSRRLLSATTAAAAALLASASGTLAADGTPGSFKIVGNSGVSAQQLFLGSPNKVYVVDKTENNPLRVTPAVGGTEHAAWGSEYDLRTNEVRAMDVVSNSFCAGGIPLGNGTWLNVGGNQAITWGGLTAASQTGGAPYDDYDGGKAIRFLDPCDDDDDCQWIDDPNMYMTTRRWYPTLETLPDGSAIIIGGCEWGGYVNGANQNNPTYEFYPPKGDGKPVTMNVLLNSLPANLFSLTWLLPSGNLFIQTNWATEIFDFVNNIEYKLDDIPNAVRTYPASGATAMLPLTPANNWTATLLFCGGTDLKADQWTTTWNIAGYPADDTCVKMTPDVSVDWEDEDALDSGRTMGQFISLPDGRLWMGNGAALGTAGYGNESWAIGRSYADQPNHQSWYFDPRQPSGSRWSKAGVSSVDRLYHSSATLLPDGSVLVSGSNPNPDYVDQSIDPSITYVTEYRVEIFYPDYWGKTKPEPVGMPKTLSYGGSYFNVSLPASAFGQSSDINATTFVVERTGFSTHAMNMGMRHVELDHTFTVADDGSAVFHVSQLPSASVLAPGPALLFCVVNGVPSNATWIMAGSGRIEEQKVEPSPVLPASSMPKSMWANPPDSSSATASDSNGAKETAGSGSGTAAGGSGGSSAADQARSVGWAIGALSLSLLGLSAL